MIDPYHSDISIARQCELISLSRASYYRLAHGASMADETDENLHLMQMIDEEYLWHPFLGSRKLRNYLHRLGYKVNRKRVQRLVRGAYLGYEYSEGISVRIKRENSENPSSDQDPSCRERSLHAAIGPIFKKFNAIDSGSAIDVALNEALDSNNKALFASAYALNMSLCVDGDWTLSLPCLIERLQGQSLSPFATNRLAYLCLLARSPKIAGVTELSVEDQEKAAELIGALYEADFGLNKAMAMGAADNFKEGNEARAATMIQKITRGYLVRKSLFKYGGGGGVKSDYLEKPSGDGGAKFE